MGNLTDKPAQKQGATTMSNSNGTISTNNSAPKEIIIKCSVEEMVKAFFQDYAILWHDPNVHNQENQQYIAKLKRFCEVLTFTEWEKAVTYTKEAKIACHVMTSGTNGELLVKEISASQSIVSIYVFCGNKAYHSTWAQNYPKVSCVETQIEAVLDKVQKNLLEWYQGASSRKLNLPAFAPIFNDGDKSEMNHLHRYLRIIPKFKNRQQAKDDFITLSRKIYSDQQNVKLIEEFENNYNEYNKEQTLRWYTQESFLYKVANNCLRIATSDSIQYCRLMLKDIEQAVKDQYQAKSKNFSGLLYRGAYLSEEEWSSLKANQDKEIEMHGFLSVSKEKKVALNFMRTDPSKKVFITIIVPKGPNEEEQGFAEIEEFSKYPDEKEILFNVRSRFTVLETEDEYVHSGDSRCRHLVLLYGAQGFHQLIAEKNPCQEVSLCNIESISCAHCGVKNAEMPGRMLYVSLAGPKKQGFSCKGCLAFGVSPFLCIPTAMDYVAKLEKTKIKGCPLMMNSSQEKIPFYGYNCCSCQGRKLQAYLVCTDCDIKWCLNCFESVSQCREIPQHNIVLETSAFSFWCEKMSANDLNHLKFQKNLVKDSVFQQAQMYFEGHQYGKAIEYYSLYIQKNEAKEKDVNLATSYNNIGLVYKDQGEYNKALEYYSKSLDIRKSVLGDNHPDTAISYNSIGLVYDNRGEYNKALEYYSKSLDIRKSVLGDNHPDTAASYNNIGVVYYNQGEYNRALEYYSKSLDIKKSVLGDNHLDTAASSHNIGLVYYNQGEYNRALEYYSKSLDIRKSVLGDNHPDTAGSYNNIANVYVNQGEYNKALEYYSKSLDIRKSVLGDNHPDTAISYNNIGIIYDNQGEYNKALEYYSKCLDISKSVLGDNHPSTAASYNNIGNIYRNQGEYNKALEYYSKSLDIRKSVLGDNHPDTAISYNNIASVYRNQREYNKALEYYSKSLDIRKSVLGDNHPDTAISYNSIGLVYDNRGEYNKALEYHSKSLDIRKSVLGDNHPDTAASYNNIGNIYRNQGEYNKALEYYSKSLDIRKSVLGDNHPDTAASYNNIAVVYDNQGEYNKALQYYLKSLDIYKSVYGDSHPNIATSCNNIGNTYNNQGEYNKALEYYSKSLDIRKSVFGDNHSYTKATKNLIKSIYKKMQ